MYVWYGMYVCMYGMVWYVCMYGMVWYVCVWYVCMYVCMLYVYACICMYVCTYVCMYVYIYMSCVYESQCKDLRFCTYAISFQNICLYASINLSLCVGDEYLVVLIAIDCDVKI